MFPKLLKQQHGLPICSCAAHGVRAIQLATLLNKGVLLTAVALTQVVKK